MVEGSGEDSVWVFNEAIWQMAKGTENSLNYFYDERNFFNDFGSTSFLALFPSLQFTFSLTGF